MAIKSIIGNGSGITVYGDLTYAALNDKAERLTKKFNDEIKPMLISKHTILHTNVMSVLDDMKENITDTMIKIEHEDNVNACLMKLLRTYNHCRSFNVFDVDSMFTGFNIDPKSHMQKLKSDTNSFSVYSMQVLEKDYFLQYDFSNKQLERIYRIVPRDIFSFGFGFGNDCLYNNTIDVHVSVSCKNQFKPAIQSNKYTKEEFLDFVHELPNIWKNLSKK